MSDDDTKLRPQDASVKPDAAYLRRGALMLGGVSLLGYLVDYGFNLGLTRFLTPHGYGDFKVAYSFAFFFGLVVLLGGDRAAPRILAPCIERGESKKVGEYLRFYLRNATLLSLGLIAITWTLSALHVGAADPEHHHPLAWVVIAVPLNAAAAMISRTLQSSHRLAQAVIPWRIGLPLMQLALFGLAIALQGKLAVSEAIGIAILSTALIAFWQWSSIRRLGLVDLDREPDFRQPREWLDSSLPMMGSFIAALALNQSDLYFLEILAEESEVGHYAAASMAAHFVPLVQVTLIGLVAPIAGPAIERGFEASRSTFRRAQSLMIGALIPVVAFLLVAAQPILALFGPQYAVGNTVLVLLVVGNFVWAVAALPSLWLQYQHRARIVLVISLATLALDSALNLLLIPRYGMEGAAAGTALTLGLAAFAVVFVYWRDGVARHSSEPG